MPRTTDTDTGQLMTVLLRLLEAVRDASLVLTAMYMIHLFSGLLIAEVAINQYEASSCDVPSSFKEFADAVE